MTARGKRKAIQMESYQKDTEQIFKFILLNGSNSASK